MFKRSAQVLLLLCLFASAHAQYHILVVNDDGYDTFGIRALARALDELGDVTVVGPRTNASGVGHGIIYKRAIEYKRVDGEGDIPVYWVDALPATCTRWAIDTLYKGRKPDLVVSGINRGINVGWGVYYSGTVAGAREATFAGVPAIAASMDMAEDSDFDGAARIVTDVARRMLEKKDFFFLNINFPAGRLSLATPVQYTALTAVRYDQRYVNRTSPRDDQPYFWIVGSRSERGEKGSDLAAVQNGAVSITPLMVDLADSAELQRMKEEAARPQKREPEPPRELLDLWRQR